MARKQPARLATARAYYRLAAKAERAGQYKQAGHYRVVADRMVAAEARNREALARRPRSGLAPRRARTVEDTAALVATLAVALLGDEAEAWAQATPVLERNTR